MTIERNEGGFGYIASCDHCSYSEDYPEAEGFIDTVEAIKEDGWLINKIDGQWDHKCPSCLAKKTTT